MFNRPNVHLVTDPISKFTPTGIEVKKGSSNFQWKERIGLDVIILATGFDPVGSFASAFDIGGDITFDKEKELYQSVPKAYLGSCLVILMSIYILYYCIKLCV